MKKMWSCVTARKCIKEASNGNIEFFAMLTEFATDPNPTYMGDFEVFANGEWCANGDTPLHNAAKNGHLEVCRLILDRCEDQNPAGACGWTPLHYAAEKGHQEVCHLILEKCEDKHPVAAGVETPLHTAARAGHLEVCRLILERCEDKNPPNVSGQTPLDFASSLGRHEIVELIRSYL